MQERLCVEKHKPLYIRKGSTGILAYRNELLAWIVDSTTVYKLHRELDGSFNFKSETLAQWVGTSHLLLSKCMTKEALSSAGRDEETRGIEMNER